MKKNDSLIIKELQQKQQLNDEIEILKKKKADMNFIVEMERKVATSHAAKLEAEKKYKESFKIIQGLESHIELILDVQKHIPRDGIIATTPHHGGDGIANLLLGDWHCEEVIEPSEVSFLNKFDLKIADKRAKSAVDVALRLIEIERYALDINKLVVYLLGDFLSGYIHEELMISNSLTPAEALLFVQDLLMSVLSTLFAKGKFSEIDVICHCGNHSRYTQGRPQYKGQAKKTFEWILYNQMARMFEFKGNKKVNFIIPTDSIYIHKQFSYPIRSQHGSNFSFMGGVGGAYIPINKKIARWNNQEKAYLDVFGHLHSFDAPKNFICNGSLVGYNQYARAHAYEYELPKQGMFFMEKKRGLVSTRQIYLEG